MKLDPDGTELYATATPIYSLDADDHGVAWRECGLDRCVARRRDHATGKVVALHEGPSIAALALDGPITFVAADQRILRIDARGTAEIAGQQPQLRALAVDDTHVYWSNANLVGLAGGGGTTRGSIVRARKDGSDLEVLAHHGDNARRITLDGDHVYWTGEAGIQSVPKSGGRTQTRLATPSHPPRSLAMSEHHVYFAGADAGRIDVRGGEPESLFAAQIVLDVAAHREHLYVTRNFVYAMREIVEEAGVFHVRNGTTSQLASLRYPVALAADRHGVYVVDGPPLGEEGTHQLLAFPHR